jgi:hypothetical protein
MSPDRSLFNVRKIKKGKQDLSWKIIVSKLFFEESTGRVTTIKEAFNQIQLFDEKAKLYCFSLRKGPVSDPKIIILETDSPTNVQTWHIQTFKILHGYDRVNYDKYR